MQKSLPSQTQLLNSMSVILFKKLNQATHNQDWARVTAISSVLKATLQCLQEVKE